MSKYESYSIGQDIFTIDDFQDDEFNVHIEIKIYGRKLSPEERWKMFVYYAINTEVILGKGDIKTLEDEWFDDVRKIRKEAGID